MEIEEDEEDEESSINFIKLKIINFKSSLLILSKKYLYSVFNFKTVLEPILIHKYVTINARGGI